MEVPRLGVESELSPLAYATATAMPDPSLACNPHHSSRQSWILNPLSHNGNSGTEFLNGNSWSQTCRMSAFFCIYVALKHNILKSVNALKIYIL